MAVLMTHYVIHMPSIPFYYDSYDYAPSPFMTPFIITTHFLLQLISFIFPY